MSQRSDEFANRDTLADVAWAAVPRPIKVWFEAHRLETRTYLHELHSRQAAHLRWVEQMKRWGYISGNR